MKKIFVLLLFATQITVFAQSPDLAKTPPMGWNSWNAFDLNINLTIFSIGRFNGEQSPRFNLSARENRNASQFGVSHRHRSRSLGLQHAKTQVAFTFAPNEV
jgi:hypothetical protein